MAHCVSHQSYRGKRINSFAKLTHQVLDSLSYLGLHLDANIVSQRQQDARHISKSLS